MSGPAAGRVVVVGAGPTGLVSAILLARRGVEVLVLERREEMHPLPRAVHADDEVVRILQAAGVAEGFAALSTPALGLRLLDARHRTMAEFTRSPGAGEHGWPQANMFDQPDLERLLRKRLAELPGVELRSGAEVVAVLRDPLRVAVRDTAGGRERIDAAAVLGCDGSGSTVHALIGAGVRDLGFRERWLVVDVVAAEPLGAWDGVHQVCDPARAATFMRVGPGRYRWEFRLHDGESPADLTGPVPLGALLAPWTHRGDLAGLEVVRTAEYTFRARLSDPWRQGRVLLLGDAAHETPPFIGQGLGSGLRDAANLAWKLAAVLLDDADDALLDTYESERRPHAESLIRTAMLVGWAMTGGQDHAAAVRRAVLAGLVRTPATTKLLDRGTPSLGAGAAVARHRRPGARPGRLLPQPTIRCSGTPTRLDDVLGDGFAVVALRPLAPGLQRVADRLGARVVVTEDPGLRAWLARGRTAAVVVRPDRVVLAAADRSGGLRGDQAHAVERVLALLRR